MSKNNSILQLDNDPKHTSKFTKKWLQDNNITVLDWPSQSPDLNPIEHAWYMVECEVRKNHGIFQNDATSYGKRLKRNGINWIEDYIFNLIESMPRRLEAVIKAKGKNTKY